MTKPRTITGIAGSLRSASYSRVVLQSIATLLPEGTRFETLDIAKEPLTRLGLRTYTVHKWELREGRIGIELLLSQSRVALG